MHAVLSPLHCTNMSMMTISNNVNMLDFFLLLWPVRLHPYVADDGAAWTNFFHCFLSLTHSAVCRKLLSLCCKSSLMLSIHLLFCRPRLLVPDTNVSSAFAGILELFIRFENWAKHVVKISVHLCVKHNIIFYNCWATDRTSANITH